MSTVTVYPGSNSQSGSGTAWANPADAYSSGTGTPATCTFDYSGNSQILSLSGWGTLSEASSLTSYVLSGYAWANGNLYGQGDFQSVTLTIDGNETDLTSAANAQLPGGADFGDTPLLLSFDTPVSATLTQFNSGITLTIQIQGSSSSTGNVAKLSQWWITATYEPIGSPPPPPPPGVAGSGRYGRSALPSGYSPRGSLLFTRTPLVTPVIVTPRRSIVLPAAYVERD